MMKALIPTLALLALSLTDGAPTRSRYKFFGEGAWVVAYWQECDLDYFEDESTMYVAAYEEVSKVQADGKPETTKRPSFDAWYNRWYDCSGDSITHTNLLIEDTTPTSVDIKTNLKSGSVSSTVQALVVTQVCKIACDTYECLEDDSETCTNCWTVCPEEGSLSEPAEVTIKATFVGTGYASKSTNHFHDSFSQRKFTGTSVDAKISALTMTVNGKTIPMPIPPYANNYGYLSTTKEGYFEITRNVK